MKKHLILMLCGIVATAMLGCGNTAKTENNSSSSTSIEESTENSDQSSSSTPSTGETITIGDYKGLVKETNSDKKIVDNDTCKITYKGIINSPKIKGTKFKINIVNKTNKKIIIQVGDFSANGKMQKASCSIHVLGNKEADDYIDEPNKVTIIDKANSVEGTLKILDENCKTISTENIKFDV